MAVFNRHSRPLAGSLGGINKLIMKIIPASFIVLTLAIGSIFALHISPYLYTKVYGNEETEKMYSVYVMAKNKESMNKIKEFIVTNSLDFVDFPKDNIITINAETDDHSETVIIWHREGKATGSRFDDFL